MHNTRRGPIPGPAGTSTRDDAQTPALAGVAEGGEGALIEPGGVSRRTQH